MNTNQLLLKLKNQLAQLEQEVLLHDKNLDNRQQKLIQDIHRFNQELFVQTGAKLWPCIEQLQKDIQQLELVIGKTQSQMTIITRCQRIQDRFLAIKRALNTTNINLKSAEQQKFSNRIRAIKRQQQSHSESGFGWIAQSVMQNSHQLYEELNKHLNWATKFEQKIEELQLKLDSCHANDKIKLQHDILAMHRRLGKCRQAISYIEERISTFERPHYSYKR